MNRFLVIIRPGESDLNSQTITEKFPDYYEVVPKCVWAIASKEHNTTVRVMDVLGMTDESDSTGVVVKIDEYNGYFERGLWETLRTWEMTL